MQVAYIEWLDANGTRGPLSGKAAREFACLLVKTAGLLVREDAEYVCVAHDYWENPEEDGTIPVAYRELEVIPMVLVKRIIRWDSEIPAAESLSIRPDTGDGRSPAVEAPPMFPVETRHPLVWPVPQQLPSMFPVEPPELGMRRRW